MSVGGRLHPSELKIVPDPNPAAIDAASDAATDASHHRDNVLAIRMQRDAAIEVVNATLHYPLGPYTRGSLKSNLFQLFGHRETGPKIEFVEAIRNLDLTIEHGERIGIIGGNGSGKSTLLRALAGIYPLKSGSMKVVGVDRHAARHHARL